MRVILDPNGPLVGGRDVQEIETPSSFIRLPVPHQAGRTLIGEPTYLDIFVTDDGQVEVTSSGGGLAIIPTMRNALILTIEETVR